MRAFVRISESSTGYGKDSRGRGSAASGSRVAVSGFTHNACASPLMQDLSMGSRVTLTLCLSLSLSLSLSVSRSLPLHIYIYMYVYVYIYIYVYVYVYIYIYGRPPPMTRTYP